MCFACLLKAIFKTMCSDQIKGGVSNKCVK